MTKAQQKALWRQIGNGFEKAAHEMSQGLRVSSGRFNFGICRAINRAPHRAQFSKDFMFYHFHAMVELQEYENGNYLLPYAAHGKIESSNIRAMLAYFLAEEL